VAGRAEEDLFSLPSPLDPSPDRRRTELQGPDLPLSPSPEGERLDPTSTPETFSAPAPAPSGDPARRLASGAQVGEEMVLDARAALTPAQLVERKLITLLRAGSLPVRSAVAGFHSGHARRPRPRRSAG
jgi:hypothetical protein